jgi:hypothetical protein
MIPFQQGLPSPDKSVGQIPSDYTEGEGTIVSGTAAKYAQEELVSAVRLHPKPTRCTSAGRGVRA